MTYSEILSVACRRLGINGFDNSLKADLRYATKFAEEELMVKTNFTKTSVQIPMSSSVTEYKLPKGFSSPHQIVFLDTDGNMIVSEETTYEHWLRINNIPENSQSEHNDFLTSDEVVGDQVDQALFRNKIAYAINYQQHDSTTVDPNNDGYYLSLKPPIDGSIQVYYTIAPVDDIYSDLNGSPVLPSHIHKYIISGVVLYMSDIEAGKALQGKDYNKVNFYKSLKAEAANEFRFNKLEALEESDPSTVPILARPYQWYDNLRRYR